MFILAAICTFIISHFLDEDECDLKTHTCHENATCTNEPGSFSCACNSGYSGDGYNCTGNETHFVYSIHNARHLSKF